MGWIRGETIGRGSFGTINLATVTNSNTIQTAVAVKSSHISNSNSLENEKRILIELGNSHPNIIQYYGDSISEEKGTQFYNLFMEYAPIGSLYDQLKKSGGRFANSRVICYAKAILNGLCHVHCNGFIHSDVKLQNVLVFEDSQVKVADFGLAKKIGIDNSGSRLRGTPMYMSPEIVAGDKEVSPAADIWAVGCAVVEMVTGKPAWEISPENDVSGLFYRIGVCGESPKIPEGLCENGKDFLRKCFLKDPKRRWTARMLLDHPFMSGCDEGGLDGMGYVSPRCPFEFSSFRSGSVESIDEICFEEELCILGWRSDLRLFAEGFGSDLGPDWSDLDGWFTIR